jgi:hypothetical protein
MTTYSLTSNGVANSITIDEREIDTSTSLELVGKFYSAWGEPYAQNFLSLLENFAGTAAPPNPRKGQLWFDTATGVLKLFGGTGPGWGNSAPSQAITTTANSHVQISGNSLLSSPIEFRLAVQSDVVTAIANNGGVQTFSTPEITVDQYGRVTNISNQGGDGTGPAQYVSSFNNRGGFVTLNTADVTTALGFTPYPNSNPNNYGPTPDLSPYVPKSGATMTGPFNMNGQRVNSLPAPISDAEPARRIDMNTAVATKTARVFNGALMQSYNVTVSPNPPSGGAEGDEWYQY